MGWMPRLFRVRTQDQSRESWQPSTAPTIRKSQQWRKTYRVVFSHCLMKVTIKLRNRNFLFKTWVFNNQFRTQCFQIYMVILEKDEAVSSKKQFEKYEIYIFAEPFYWFCLTSCGKEDIWRSLLYYCFSREMDILYSTSHSNQWSLPKHWK